MDANEQERMVGVSMNLVENSEEIIKCFRIEIEIAIQSGAYVKHEILGANKKKEKIEQHRVHRVITHCTDTHGFAYTITSNVTLQCHAKQSVQCEMQCSAERREEWLGRVDNRCRKPTAPQMEIG